MPPKKKRRKIQVGGKRKTEEEKRKDFVINSTLEERDVNLFLQNKEMGKLKENMSRGQRKRFKNYERKMEKKDLVEKIKFDFEIEEEEEEDESLPKPRPLLSLEEGDTVDERFFMDMQDLEDSLNQLQEKDIRPQGKKKVRQKDFKKLIASELQQLNDVLSHEAFLSNPEQALSEHLDNKIELENIKLGIEPDDNNDNNSIVPPPPFSGSSVVPPPIKIAKSFVRKQKTRNAKKRWREKQKRKRKKKKLIQRTGKKRKRDF